jgi:2-succinyl-6-hydroxy-2,4-cyclohexadiene-1-carboxylate synthase
MKLYCRGAAYYLTIHQRNRLLPNLLLMHGFMGSSDAFGPLTEFIKPICNPITIDLLGHGKSDPVTDSERYDARSQVSDLVSILSRLQLSNVWLYGYSMGGRLAQNLALELKDFLDGLILESTHCGLQSDSDRKERQSLDEQRASEILEDFNSFTDKWSSLSLFDSPDQASSLDYRSIIKSQSPDAMAASLRGFGAGSAPYVCEKMMELSLPIGLIAGEADEKYVDKMREMHHLFPDSTFSVVAGAGHRVHADQPEQIATFLTNYFETYG